LVNVGAETRALVPDALTGLGFVSVKIRQLDPARQYSQQAFRLAHADDDRPAGLYPLLVTGQVAARVGSTRHTSPATILDRFR
jgi:hypothetical protein